MTRIGVGSKNAGKRDIRAYAIEVLGNFKSIFNNEYFIDNSILIHL